MRKIIKKTIFSILIAVCGLIVIVAGYVAYVSIQYYRIDDHLDLPIINNQNDHLDINTNYSISTYNIGFGAYTRDFSFFMDSGVMKDGTPVKGTGSKAKSQEVVLANTDGAIEIIDSLNPDFMFFQEVDVDATRSHHINQYAMLKDCFTSYGDALSYNFHSAFLFYPLTDPHGATKAGIVTFSKYEITSSTRYKLPIDESFPNKFFDLDRCFMVSRIPVNDGKELVLINVHLSAYDEGGLIRSQQLNTLNAILEQEYAKGNYVIAGGDFNHDIANSLHTFATDQEVPEWVYVLDEDKLPSGFTFATSNLNPTCRSTDMAYISGVNYTVVIDGFIISNNIEEISVNNIVTVNEEDVSFLYSDHNPVKLHFKLGE